MSLGWNSLLRRTAVIGVVAGSMTLAFATSAFASVATDAYYYDAGGTVQISGDSMWPGEPVTVDVNYPDGSLAQEDVVTATETGTFTDSYTLPLDAPYGVYAVVATGQQSQNVYTTTFDPSTTTSLTPPSTVTYGAPLTLSGSVVHNGNNDNHPEAGVDVLLQEDATTSHDCSTHDGQGANDNTGFVKLDETTTDTNGDFSETFHAKASSFAPTEDSGRTHYFLTYQPSVGTYGFRASHKGNLGAGIGNISTSGCQTTSVVAAPTTTTGLLGNNTASDSVAFGTAEKITYDVSSHYGVSGNTMYGGVSAVMDTGPSGASLGCVVNTSPTTATPAAISKSQSDGEGGASDVGFDYPSNDSTNTTKELLCTPSAVGVYTLHLHFADNAANAATNADGNYLGSDSGTLTLTVTGSPTVLPTDNQVTDSSLCTFDVDGTVTGSQFRLIYTPDSNAPSTYKLNASNPGQFYYNVLYEGTGGETVTLTIPYPFVTKGAVPTHVYDSVSPYINSAGQMCYNPSAATVLSTSAEQVALTGSRTVTVTVPAGVTEAYINIHLDYGLKSVAAGCTSDASANATCNGSSIGNLSTYKFAADFGSTTLNSSVQNENVFKRDPGIGGLILTAGSGTPLAGTQVRVYDGTGKLLGNVYADQDGWYMWNYKYTGKSATFTVTVPAYNKSQAATLKSNGFLVVNFSA